MIQNTTLEEVPCPMGCEPDDKIVLTGTDLLYQSSGTFQIAKCNQCGLMRTHPRPTAQAMSAHYPDNYSPHQVAVSHSLAPGRPWLSALKSILGFDNDRLPCRPPGKVLEIGCGSGAFLYRLAQQGWDVCGLEASLNAVERARMLGLDVRHTSIENATDPTIQYNLIIGLMVLEHVHDPLLMLKKLHQWTNKGAWLVLSVPNAQSIEFTLFRKYWYALQLPTHLWHFTPITIARLLERNKWRVVRVVHQKSEANLVASIGLLVREKTSLRHLADSLVRYADAPPLWARLALKPLGLLQGIAGQSGRMTIWAKRED
jgi:2-polyprenyl-3-methyl-5-hydroxy-6-metoxy-1,4-benzoquinol methylase